MPLVNMREMLDHAYRNGYAVGGFDLVSLDFLEAIMAAAERAARRSSIPVAIHLDHGASLDSAIRAINLGCNGVMVDASHEPFAGNVAKDRRHVTCLRGTGRRRPH